MFKIHITNYILIIVISFCAGQHQHFLDSSNFDQFLSDFDEIDIVQLPKGDSNYHFEQLEIPIHFYNEKYDHIYINTNGILTFVTEFSDYLNQPFPLEYPTIAPFYANIDTTSNETTEAPASSISFFKSQNPEKLKKLSDLVRYGFEESDDFEATILYVGTWQNVGYFDAKSDKQNNFQVIIICNDDETYVQFTYLKDGLNWLHADMGSSGLSDIRAQAGFISEDGRSYTLTGSGTENVRFLSGLSNVGVPGVWLFKVGPFSLDGNISEPNTVDVIDDSSKPETCRDGLYRNCHPDADCIDTNMGFCCKCHNGYYGNGFSCIKNTIPIRVTGSISGTINDQTIDGRAKLQSYIVMTDGRSYTAVNPIASQEGQQLAMVLPIGSAIGWLFAQTQFDAKNGYDLTGGQLNHYSTLKFKDTNEIFHINQTFDGLNHWDQLSMKTELSGYLPYLAVGTKLQVRDYIAEYTRISKTQIRSASQHIIEIPAENRIIEYNLEQLITFEICPGGGETDDSQQRSVYQKVSKINLDYSEHEQALRIGLLVKVGIDPKASPCTDGTANCGENTYCTVNQEDHYDCTCLNGYMADSSESESEIENCIDINECLDGSYTCDENSECQNSEGGYNCVCFEGYERRGYGCELNQSMSDNQMVTETTSTERIVEETPQEEHPCSLCSREAICVNSVCQCREDWHGDGFDCWPRCPDDEQWINEECVPRPNENTESTVRPYCPEYGECTCPENYEYLIDENICSYGTKSEESVESCDIDFNCHLNATCDWSENDLRYICNCDRGFEGDGYICDKIETTCTTTPDLCDDHASCMYNDQIGKSECKCDRGYEGNGFRCQLAPECSSFLHCDAFAICLGGICTCEDGYERDLSDFCVPAGKCGGAYCTDNAICKWDSQTQLQYCECMDGYSGDGVIMCTSKPLACNVRNTCGLYASCVPNYNDYSEYNCVCNAGYYGDGYVCVEERNCRNTPSMCHMEATCSETTNGLNCICNQGFLGNGTICKKITAHDSGFLLLSQGVVIIRVPYSGKFGRPIAVASMAIGLDKDCIEGRVYWVDISAKKIMSSKYDGTDSKTIISKDVESPEGIAIDWISRRLYWTDSTKDTIEVASIDNPEQRAIIINKNLVNPRGIAVDPFKQKVYWSDWNRAAPKIEMSNLDGSERQLIASTELILPNSLVILNPGGHHYQQQFNNNNNNDLNHGTISPTSPGELCFADAGTHEIKCIDTDNHISRTIAQNLSYPFGLTIDNENNFYWTDWITKQIESVDMNGIRRQGIRTPVFGSHKMYGMTAVTESCPLLHSVCSIDNGSCQNNELCLANDRLPTYKTCKCSSAVSIDCK